MEEKMYYNSDGIQVTSSRIVMGNTTYSLRNVSSVKKNVHTYRPSSTLEALLTIFGIGVLLIGFIGTVQFKSESVWFLMIIGAAITGGALFLISRKKTTYTYIIVLGTNAGEQRGYQSSNQSMIDEIIGAINNSIVEYKP